MVGVLDGMQTNAPGGLDVLDAIVNEERGFCRVADAVDRVMVDALVRLGNPEAVREGVVLESREPGEAFDNSAFHGVADVGEDSGGDAGALQSDCPIDHRLIRLRPEIDVGCEELREFAVAGRVAELRADDSPELDATEGTEVVVVPVAPVGDLECSVRRVEDCLHAAMGEEIWRAAEDEAIVEENRTNRRHLH